MVSKYQKFMVFMAMSVSVSFFGEGFRLSGKTSAIEEDGTAAETADSNYLTEMEQVLKSGKRPQAWEYKSYDVFVNTDSYTVFRQLADAGSEVIGYLFNNTKVRVLEWNDEGVRVMIGDQQGFIDPANLVVIAQYTEDNEGDAQEGTAEYVQDENYEGTETVQTEAHAELAVVSAIADGTRVLKAADASSKCYEEVPAGTAYIKTGEVNGFCEVQYTNDVKGYVAADQLYALEDTPLYLTPDVVAARTAQVERVAEEERKEEEERKAKEEAAKKAAAAAAAAAAAKKAASSSSSSSSSSVSGEWQSIGSFKITGYDACPQCCGGRSDPYTATGTLVKANYTIAVDKRVIPLGSLIKIEGSDIIYHAEDTGVIGRTIDIYFNTDAEADDWGVRYRNVYILTP